MAPKGTKDAPCHVAIIMDGNGRWAKERNLARIEGHRAGMQSVRETVRSCLRLGIEVLTLYAFSVENWRRPKTEVRALMSLLRGFVRSETQEMQDNGIRLGLIGNIEDLPKSVRSALAACTEKTRDGDKIRVNLALSYSGRDEIVRAARSLGRDISEGRVKPAEIDEAAFAEYLDTGGLPDPDLLIRTSGEFRVSNFLLWQIAYTEIYVTSVLWPDFREKDLLAAFEDYSRRSRRYGGVEADGAI